MTRGRLDPETALFNINSQRDWATAELLLPTMAPFNTTPPTFDAGTLFDVSGWETWALYFFGYRPPAGWVIRLHWVYDIDELTNTSIYPHAVDQIVYPGSVANNTFNPVIVGRVAAPLVYVTMFANDTPGTLGQAIAELFVSNRPRHYDAPYTPHLMGTVLANIVNTSVAPGGNIAFTPLPFYLGPARLNINVDSTSDAQGHLRDNAANPNELASVYASQPVSNLWIPSLILGAGAWGLTMHVNAAATGNQTIGATVVAGEC